MDCHRDTEEHEQCMDHEPGAMNHELEWCSTKENVTYHEPKQWCSTKENAIDGPRTRT